MKNENKLNAAIALSMFGGAPELLSEEVVATLRALALRLETTPLYKALSEGTEPDIDNLLIAQGLQLIEDYLQSEGK